MLNSIRRGPKLPAERNAIDLLVECHGRIRQFTGIADRLAKAQGVAEQEIRDAALGLVRYFTIALPLHSEDEERSLRPKLLEADLPVEVRKSLEEMVEEHIPIHETIDELVVSWRTLIEAPGELEPLRPLLLEGADELSSLFVDHLAKEEAIIFPAARSYLRPEVIAALFEEMRGRREGQAFGG